MDLRPRGGRKLALQNGKVEGSEVGKNTALFLEAKGWGGVFDLKNQGLGFAPGRKKPCYRKSNSS